ncbi:Arc family DNA-binding protein [Aliihoeflea sp. 2WW]|uniref:Arc family DNA-binding protein n=1 Tax=Aliihoeflea sp. 2WW TaxID=1381123 RepID=UPI0013768416|nr:Arc family DNA-binding protein [Aliihoeflea sp. 2WW]
MEQQMHTIKPFGLRMPDDVKAWLTARAKRSKRSMNSELLLLLEQAMSADQQEAA